MTAETALATGAAMRVADDVTVMILTYNEIANIERTLDAVRWAPKILVIDSGSTDDTLAIVGRYSQARVAKRAFDSFAGQCNFGLSLIETEWVLSMDADYEVSEPLAREIASLTPSAEIAGWKAGFVYRIFGQGLRATLYPPRTVLYRAKRATYQDEGHGHRVVVDGAVAALSNPIYHDDRKPLARWLQSQLNYARLEADHLLETPRERLRRTDRLRLMGWLAPPLVFIYTLLVKRCLLDGWAGWSYALQRLLAETLIALELLDRRLRRR